MEYLFQLKKHQQILILFCLFEFYRIVYLNYVNKTAVMEEYNYKKTMI